LPFYTFISFFITNQVYVVTCRGLISIADRTTCSLFAVAAVTFNTSLSCNTKGAVSNSIVALAPIALVLNKLNTAGVVSVIVTVNVSALPESSDTNIDFITAVVAVGTVYNVVTLVAVRSAFLFIKEFAISLRKS
jgi:hypothetical protein